MTDSEIQLMHRMYGFLKSNKTHEILVSKAMPGSDLPKLMQKAEKQHQEIVSRLMKDKTKTEASKTLFAARNAETQIMILLKMVDKERNNAFALKESLEDKLSEILRPAEPNPALGMERQLVLQNLKGLSFSEIHSLVREGDKDVTKAIESPLAKKMFELTKGNRQQSITEASERCLLTEIEHQNLMLARRGVDAYLAMGEGLGDLAGTCIRVQREIQETIVEEAA